MRVSKEYAQQLKTFNPHTYSSLKKSFEYLGVKKGMVLIVHSSLSSLGWTCGGPVTVINALMDVVTPSGTLIMPTPTPEYSEPSTWKKNWIPKDWWNTFRKEMPPFNPLMSPSRQAGVIAETFRTFPRVKRTWHPTCSFAVWGKNAREFVDDTPLDHPYGKGSVLEKIYNANGYILLLGVENAANLSLYLALERSLEMTSIKDGAPIMENDKRVWKTFYRHQDQSSELLNQIASDFAKEFSVRRKSLGFANISLMNQRKLVDYASAWLQKRSR